MRAAARFLQQRGVTKVMARGFALQPVPPRRPAAPACQVSDRYLARAVESAEDIVRTARCGERSDTLNREAYRLARFAAKGRIGSAEIETRLLAATTLPQYEARATIRSALRARGAIHA
jgi:hypothetical protein